MDIVNVKKADEIEIVLTKYLHPVGFEPTRIGDTVGLKSTSLDHSDKDARSLTIRCQP